MNSPQQSNNPTEVGFVTEVRDFLVHIDGLPTVKVNDLVVSDNNVRGWVTSLDENSIQALLLDEGTIKPGQQFRMSDRGFTLNVGDFLLGRSINPLGSPIDGKGLFSASSNLNPKSLDQQAPGISQRQFITDQFETGITLVDSLVPLGKGQRELLVGDPRSGMDSFLTDVIINQRGKKVVCIYAAIGKPIQEIRNLIDTLSANSALAFTTIIAAASSDPAPLIYLTPKVALTVAEYFQKKGLNVLLILDDLGKHAKIYREIALLSDRVPTRESYPADIFHEHAHIMERAGSFNKLTGGGSITALPVIEINLNDFTGFIPTNLMSMTDGHLLFKSALFAKGQRPAVDISLSVTRVGLQTQSAIQKLLSSKIKALLARASQLQTLSHFSSELSPETQLVTKQGRFIEEVLKQESLTFTPREIQVLLLGLTFTDFLLTKDLSFLIKNKQKIIQAFGSDPQLSKVPSAVLKIKDEDYLLKLLQSCIPFLEAICK